MTCVNFCHVCTLILKITVFVFTAFEGLEPLFAPSQCLQLAVVDSELDTENPRIGYRIGYQLTYL